MFPGLRDCQTAAVSHPVFTPGRIVALAVAALALVVVPVAPAVAAAGPGQPGASPAPLSSEPTEPPLTRGVGHGAQKAIAASDGSSADADLAIRVAEQSVDGLAASYELVTTQPAACRQTSLPGVPYTAAYQDIGKSSDGLNHTAEISLGVEEGLTVYAVCVTASGQQAEIQISLKP